MRRRRRSCLRVVAARAVARGSAAREISFAFASLRYGWLVTTGLLGPGRVACGTPIYGRSRSWPRLLFSGGDPVHGSAARADGATDAGRLSALFIVAAGHAVLHRAYNAIRSGDDAQRAADRRRRGGRPRERLVLLHIVLLIFPRASLGVRRGGGLSFCRLPGSWRLQA
jgi:hypothetical protein